MSKRETEETRRRQILDAAERVFAERGIDKARMDDIVEKSGLSKGALYWYFKSKDALIQALLDRVFINEMREAEALVEQEGSSSERLRKFAGYAVEEYKRFKKLMPLAYEFIALAARSKAVRGTLLSYYERYMEFVATIVQQGIARGEFKPCDPEIVAKSLIALYEGIAMLWFIEPDLIDWDEMEPEPVELILSGLKVR